MYGDQLGEFVYGYKGLMGEDCFSHWLDFEPETEYLKTKLSDFCHF